MFAILVLWLTISEVTSTKCVINEHERQECGYLGISRERCENFGCCWNETTTPNIPWCTRNTEMIKSECQVDYRQKVDCGFYWINEEQCLLRGCCWIPLQRSREPWCFRRQDGINMPMSTETITNVAFDEEHVTPYPYNPKYEGLVELEFGDHGRVGIWLDSQFGTICDDLFDYRAADVACRSAISHQRFVRGEVVRIHDDQVTPYATYILMDDVECNGDENSLSECHFLGAKDHNCDHTEDVYIRCYEGFDEGFERELRLVGEGSNNSGLVIIYHDNRWGTICDDSIEDEDVSNILCRQLGFLGGSFVVPEHGYDTGPIHIQSMHCPRGAQFSDCEIIWNGGHKCSHIEDAGLHCENEIASISWSAPTSWRPMNEGKVQLEFGDHGRVGIWHDGVFGTVCDDYFHYPDADVACRSVLGNSGFVRGEVTQSNHDTRSLYLPILMDDLGCNGDESSLAECEFSGWGVHNCGREEVVSIRCYSTFELGYEREIRLTGNTNAGSGRVEIYHDNRWGTVCDDTVRLGNVTDIMCRHLGFDGGFYTKPDINPSNLPVHVRAISCPARSDFLNCTLEWGGYETCVHSEDVGLQCGITTGVAENNSELDVRLTGLNSRSGRVEIFHEGQWGTACNKFINKRDVLVLCRTIAPQSIDLGLVGGVAIEGPHDFEESDMPIWLADLYCLGHELNIAACGRPPFGRHGCNHGDDLFIECDFLSHSPSKLGEIPS